MTAPPNTSPKKQIPSSRAVTRDQIQERKGVLYKVNQVIPFTGLMQDFYPNGQKKQEGNIKDGNKHGVETWWHEDGTKVIETRYENGVKKN